MDTPTPSAQPSPIGLGGWLWPLGIALAVLPLWMAMELGRSATSLSFAIQNVLSPEHSDDDLRLSADLILSFLALLAATIAHACCAELFFRRSRHFRSTFIAATLASIAAMLGTTLHYLSPLGPGALSRAIVPWTMPLTWSGFWILYLLLARRPRITFAGAALPETSDPLFATAFHGPREWNRGRWLLFGFLLLSLIAHWHSIRTYGWYAMQPMPPPPEPLLPEEQGTAAALRMMGDMRPWIAACRIRLAIDLAAMALLPVAFVLFARRSRWFRLALPIMLILAIASPASEVVLDPIVFLHRPSATDDLHGRLIVAAIVATVLLFAPRVRNGPHARQA